MTARFFCFNSFAGAQRSSSVAVTDGDTTSGNFDSGFVSNCMKVNTNTEFISRSAPFDDGSSTATTIWVRGDWICGATIVNQALIQMQNGVSNAYRLFLSAGVTLQPQYWNGSSWVNWGTTFTVATVTRSTIVWKVVANTSFQVYVGGILVASGAGTLTGAQTAVSEVRFGSITSQATFWSQCMAADYDIRDAKFQVTTLNGNSAVNTAGTGTYTDINEAVLNDGTSILIAAAGKMGQTKASLTIPTGYAIIGGQINARGRVTGGVVTQGKLGWRSGSTNGSSSDRVYNGGYEPRGALQTTDPNTGSAWGATPFNNAEIYEEAA